jgi:hypothetical protein
MKEYTFSYRFDNKTWAISIYADSEKEAKRKFWTLAENGQYNGEIVHKVNATKPYSFIKYILSKFKI